MGETMRNHQPAEYSNDSKCHVGLLMRPMARCVPIVFSMNSGVGERRDFVSVGSFARCGEIVRRIASVLVVRERPLMRVLLRWTVTDMDGSHQSAIRVVEDVAMEHPGPGPLVEGDQEPRR